MNILYFKKCFLIHASKKFFLTSLAIITLDLTTSLSIEQDINKYDLSTHTSQVLT